MTRQGNPTVLIVDDEIDMRILVRTVLEAAKRGVEVVGEAADGLDALDVFYKLDPPQIPDVVILDNRMPGRSGIEVAADILQREPRQHVVLFSAFLTPDLEDEARALGIAACLDKTAFDRLPQLVLELATKDHA